MNLWHLHSDTPRSLHGASGGQVATLILGTWPIEPDQHVAVSWQSRRRDGSLDSGRVEATWQRNAGVNSYWQAELGPFAVGDRVEYAASGSCADGGSEWGPATFRVEPLRVAILWHQHQPLYRDTRRSDPRGSYRQPWVRLHAIRDYYAMAAVVAQHPQIHLTINLSPALLWQIEDYVERGATDEALELSLRSPGDLTTFEREQLLSTFFDADWHNQIFPHARYKELFLQRAARRAFTAQDLLDLQAWFNLAWFGKEFRDGSVTLTGGVQIAVDSFVGRGRGFTSTDVREIVAAQIEVMRAVIPIHRALQDAAQIEISTTPFYHPILPLLFDTDRATIDRPGTCLPPRFSHPEDADAQVRRAVGSYQARFGRRPHGMWPAEGAVSQFIIPTFADNEIVWIASDGGVLARSGLWGYDVHDPDVLCRPYLAREGKAMVVIFFRDHELSDAIGFRYQSFDDSNAAAAEFVVQLKKHAVRDLDDDSDRVVTIVLDGENAWGAYRDDGRPFLHALYGALASDELLQTVTFAEYLRGDMKRGLQPHRPEDLRRVDRLFTGSWIDEAGSAPGVDLGTWIGEPEENRGWDLVRQAREFLSARDPEAWISAFEALYAAEGSDWFWWLGDDQDSGSDDVFDDLFRMHLKNVYEGTGETPPVELDRHLVPHVVVWTFTNPATTIQPGDQLAVVTNCPGELSWSVNHGPVSTDALALVGGVMSGARRHSVKIGPFRQGGRVVTFRFRCMHPGCDCRAACCAGDEHVVLVEDEGASGSASGQTSQHERSR